MARSRPIVLGVRLNEAEYEVFRDLCFEALRYFMVDRGESVRFKSRSDRFRLLLRFMDEVVG